MIATGIIRRIDELGRIAIPSEIRRQLRVKDGDPFEIFTTKDGEVIFKPSKPRKYTLRQDDYWEELIAPDGKMLCCGHQLSVIDILDALGIPYSEENLDCEEEEEQSSSFF